MDYEDGDEIPTEVDGRIPKYNCQRQVGTSLIHKLDCYECYVCGRFFDTEKTSEIHTRTVTHHRNFVKFLNEKANDTKIAQKRAAAALEEIERKWSYMSGRMSSQFGKNSSHFLINWFVLFCFIPDHAGKKKKLEAAEAAANATEEEAKPQQGDGGDEAYDPTETTDDPEDDEKTEQEPMEQDNEEQKDEQPEAEGDAAAPNGDAPEQAAMETPNEAVEKLQEEVATPKRAQRARGRGRNARL